MNHFHKRFSLRVFFFPVLASVLIIIISGWSIASTRPAQSGCSLLHTYEKDIITASGNKILLKGLSLSNNTWGTWVDGVSDKLAGEGKDALIRPSIQDPWVLTDEDFTRLGSLGVNCVRYCVNYQLFAANNPNLANNLAKLKQHIERFASLRIYTIVTLYMTPGLDTQNDITEMGKPGSTRLKTVFEDDSYFKQWISMWKTVAATVKKTPGLAGYEIANEPRLPCDKDGGMKRFKSCLLKVCKEIRRVDPDHILFIPVIRSREANPGELYWNQKIGIWKTDEGEQGIIWGDQFIKVNVPNIVYTFHAYIPLEFTTHGNGTYKAADLEKYLSKKYLTWAAHNGPFPLMATEYGICRKNSPEKRIVWLKVMHRLFNKYGISATFFEYKAPIGAFTATDSQFFALYAQYVNWPNEIFLRNNQYFFQSVTIQKAAEKGFTPIFEEYFLKHGKIEPVSLLDNQPVLNCLKKYWK